MQQRKLLEKSLRYPFQIHTHSFLISHCCNVYGERQHYEKFIPNTIKKVLNGDKVIIHTDENNVPGSRYYLHNEDLADTILFLLNNYKW